jgi:hypothetical protein
MEKNPFDVAKSGGDAVSRSDCRWRGDESPLARGRARRERQAKGSSRAGTSAKSHLAADRFSSGGDANDIEAAPESARDVVGLAATGSASC